MTNNNNLFAHSFLPYQIGLEFDVIPKQYRLNYVGSKNMIVNYDIDFKAGKKPTSTSKLTPDGRNGKYVAHAYSAIGDFYCKITLCRLIGRHLPIWRYSCYVLR